MSETTPIKWPKIDGVLWGYFTSMFVELFPAPTHFTCFLGLTLWWPTSDTSPRAEVHWAFKMSSTDKRTFSNAPRRTEDLEEQVFCKATG